MKPVDDGDDAPELSDLQCLVLAAIDLSGGVDDVPALADAIGVTPDVVREILLELEAAGLVERQTEQ